MKDVLFEELSKDVIIKEIPSIDNSLFYMIKHNTVWDESLSSRKTASYGIPYIYSGVSYSYLPIPDYLVFLQKEIQEHIGFLPNNCLINYYPNGRSKMGFHSDQIDQLVDKSGVAIFSLGSKRIIRFKNKIDTSKAVDIELKPNTLFYMSQEIQKDWLHAILPDKDNSLNERISITFRLLKNQNSN